LEAVRKDREVGWEGFFNTRDLGGLPTSDGGRTRFGVFFRSADLRFVTPAGWRAARAAGVRTVLDLRNDDEIQLAGSAVGAWLAADGTETTAETGAVSGTAAVFGGAAASGVSAVPGTGVVRENAVVAGVPAAPGTDVARETGVPPGIGAMPATGAPATGVPAAAPSTAVVPGTDLVSRVGQAGTEPPTSSENPAVSGVRRRRVPLDDIQDTEFWNRVNQNHLNGSPLYYGPFLARKTRRCAAVITVLARAGDGVLFHCGAGRDRTGLVALLLLSLAGVEQEAIVEDYELSTVALGPLFTALGQPDQAPAIELSLRRHRTTVRAAILAVLDGFDAEAYLLAAGVSSTDLAMIRRRLVA
jgi:protein-tyrosine phosphatase